MENNCSNSSINYLLVFTSETMDTVLFVVFYSNSYRKFNPKSLEKFENSTDRHPNSVIAGKTKWSHDTMV